MAATGGLSWRKRPAESEKRPWLADANVAAAIVVIVVLGMVVAVVLAITQAVLDNTDEMVDAAQDKYGVTINVSGDEQHVWQINGAYRACDFDRNSTTEDPIVLCDGAELDAAGN